MYMNEYSLSKLRQGYHKLRMKDEDEKVEDCIMGGCQEFVLFHMLKERAAWPHSV
jgi:hypothetical protein